MKRGSLPPLEEFVELLAEVAVRFDYLEELIPQEILEGGVSGVLGQEGEDLVDGQVARGFLLAGFVVEDPLLFMYDLDLLREAVDVLVDGLDFEVPVPHEPVRVLGVNKLAQEVAGLALELEARLLPEAEPGDVEGNLVGVLFPHERPQHDVKRGAAPENGDRPLKLKGLVNLCDHRLHEAGVHHADLDMVLVLLVDYHGDLPGVKQVRERVLLVDHRPQLGHTGT